jgi:uncharacterized damage-inducible protein DinB
METTATDAEAKRIAQTLRDTYAGDAWVGPSLHDILRGLTPAQAYSHPIPNAHSVWEIILHMTAWRLFAWHRLEGNSAFTIASPEEDWPPVENDSLPAWEAALTGLEKSQQLLLAALDGLPDAKLRERVPGKDYSFYKLLHGIIGHDLYHGGQIVLLRKMA